MGAKEIQRPISPDSGTKLQTVLVQENMLTSLKYLAHLPIYTL